MIVLIIDDEVILAKALKRAFEKRGHQVELGSNGDEGLTKWIQLKPDIVLLDVIMPELTGPQVLKEMQRLHKETFDKAKVILMTAHSSVNSKKEAVELGAHDLLRKPFEDIFLIVENLVKD